MEIKYVSVFKSGVENNLSSVKIISKKKKSPEDNEEEIEVEFKNGGNFEEAVAKTLRKSSYMRI